MDERDYKAMNTHTIEIETYPNGVMASCRWKNRRICVFYEHETHEFTTEIKAYFKENHDAYFCKTKYERGIQKLAYHLTHESFCILTMCQTQLIVHLNSKR